MATIPKANITCVGTTEGGPPLTLSFPEAATQTFSAGAPVVLDTNGRVAIATVAGGVVTATNAQVSGKILGFAAEPGHNGAADANQCKVYIAQSNTLFLANIGVAGGGGTSAQNTVMKAPAASNTGYDIRELTAGSLYTVDTAVSAQGHARIVQLDSRDVAGDTNGRVLFVVPTTKRLFD